MFRVKMIQVVSFLALAAFSFSVCAGDYAVVRHLEGKVYVQGSDSNERESLTVNSPLFEGDNIWAVDGSAGILFGDGSIVWLSSDSHLEISKFPDPVPDPPFGMRVHLWRGLMLLEVPASLPGESSHVVMTPAASVKAFRKGLSLVEVETVDRTRLTVLEGSAVIGSSGQYAIVNQSEMSYAEYGYEPMSPISAGSFSYPEIVEFRDRSISRPVKNGRSREYVDPDLYPYADDLDYYGEWQTVPSYGHVWFPSSAYMGAGWNPYYNGYWHYTPWGSTWVSYEPWGWVPFHYGRWTFVIGLGWGWIPDSFFSPAWVSWYWGDGWIGWCPLGYWGPLWEPCGWYSVQINNIYVTNVTKVVNVNKHGPPPGKPIIPVSKDGAGGVNIKRLQQKGSGDILVTPHGGLNLHPAKIKDLQTKRISLDDLKRTLSDPPVSTRDRRIATATSLDRQDDPLVGKGRGAAAPPALGRETPTTPRARDSWDRDALPPSRETPRDDEPARSGEPRTRSYDGDSYQPSREAPARETPTRNVQPSREAPARETPARNAQPSREQPRANESPRSDSSSGDRKVSPPPSSSQPASPPTSSSDSQSKPSKQRSGLSVSSGLTMAAKAVMGAVKGTAKSGNKNKKSSSSSSSQTASYSKKKNKN